MSKFAVIEEVEKFKKVTYYTVRFLDEDDEKEEESEFEKFITKHQNDTSIEEEYSELMSWIVKIGNKIGAKKIYFRAEKAAHAFIHRKTNTN